MTRQFGSIWFWFSALALAILAVFLLYPLLNVLTGSIGSGGRNGWVTLAGDPKYFAAIVNTIVLGIAVTLTTTLIGVPLAYFTARFDFPGKGIVAVLIAGLLGGLGLVPLTLAASPAQGSAEGRSYRCQAAMRSCLRSLYTSRAMNRFRHRSTSFLESPSASLRCM